MSHEIYTRLCVCILLGGYLTLFSHTIKGCFIGSGAIVWLPGCKWSKPEGYDIHSSMCNIFHETCTCLLEFLFRLAYHCIFQYCSVPFQWQWNNRMKMVKTEGCHTRAKYNHDDVITSKRFLCRWQFVRGIHRSSAVSSNKGSVTWSVHVPLMLARTYWASTRMVGDLGCHAAHVTSL